MDVAVRASKHIQAFVQQLHLLQTRPAPPVSRKINNQALFSALLQNQLREQAGEAESRQAEHLINAYFEAVLLCRRSQLPEALAQLIQADEQVPQLPAATVDFVTLFRLSAWGNYYYKQGEAERAVDQLRQGLEISAGLERRGYPAFIYRRIEQIQNIAVIYFKQHQPMAGHQLLKSALTFVHSGRAAGLLTDDWDAATLRHLRSLQENTLEAVLDQLVAHNTTTMAHPQYGSAFYYQHYFKDLLRDLHADTYNRVVLYNWLYAKASYFEEGLEAFLQNLLTFLADDAVTADYDVFKANLLAQAVWAFELHGVEAGVPEAVRTFAAATLKDRSGRAIRMAA